MQSQLLLPDFSPQPKDGFCGSIGNTPLLRLHTLSEATGCAIYGKAEFMNPGGSVKDRAALGMILEAEQKGLLREGGTVVEGTAGNTGIGLTLVSLARGYTPIIIIPDNQSPEKIDLLRALGAEVRPVPPAPYSDPGNYNHIAARLAADTPNSFWANQFDNTANRRSHYRSTGPEIWRQTSGKVTAFAAAIGTGGTLAGTALYLKEQNPEVRIVVPDPYGAAMWSWFSHGHTEFDDGDSIAEGIGQGRVTKNVEGAPVDVAHRVPDDLAVEMVYHLLRREGLFLGSSCGINVCGAVKQALAGGPGQVIVTILCDGAQRYMSRLFNPDWLEEQNLRVRGLPLEQLLEEIRNRVI